MAILTVPMVNVEKRIVLSHLCIVYVTMEHDEILDRTPLVHRVDLFLSLIDRQ